jgi:hypothetical protein
MSHDNAENARDELDRKLAMMGYVHPEEPQTSDKRTGYHVYVEGSDTLYGKARNTDVYSRFNEDQTQNMLSCPRCKELRIYECDCEFNCLTCKNGHTWYTDPKTKTIKIGDPHEDESD